MMISDEACSLCKTIAVVEDNRGCSATQPMPVPVASLDRKGPPSKMSEGYFRFLCPNCGEMLATVNPRNNLAHCFACENNYNNIDLLMSEGHTFRGAVRLLQAWLKRYRASRSRQD